MNDEPAQNEKKNLQLAKHDMSHWETCQMTCKRGGRVTWWHDGLCLQAFTHVGLHSSWLTLDLHWGTLPIDKSFINQKYVFICFWHFFGWRSRRTMYHYSFIWGVQDLGAPLFQIPISHPLHPHGTRAVGKRSLSSWWQGALRAVLQTVSNFYSCPWKSVTDIKCL